MHLAEGCMWHTSVIIPKVCSNFHGIDHVEVLWKMMIRMMNQRLTLAIGFHDTLNVLYAGQGTGDESLKAKIIQQQT